MKKIIFIILILLCLPFVSAEDRIIKHLWEDYYDGESFNIKIGKEFTIHPKEVAVLDMGEGNPYLEFGIQWTLSDTDCIEKTCSMTFGPNFALNNMGVFGGGGLYDKNENNYIDIGVFRVEATSYKFLDNDDKLEMKFIITYIKKDDLHIPLNYKFDIYPNQKAIYENVEITYLGIEEEMITYFIKETDKQYYASTKFKEKYCLNDNLCIIPSAYYDEEYNPFNDYSIMIKMPIITLELHGQKDQCMTNAHCNDNNPDTEDLCKGSPKKCYNKYIETTTSTITSTTSLITTTTIPKTTTTTMVNNEEKQSYKKGNFFQNIIAWITSLF